MARIEINNDIGGIELYFDTVPTEEDKEALKKNGFRWHAEKKCWYAKNTDNNREVASSIFDRIDKFNEETRNIIKVNDAGFDYAVIVMQAGKQCEVILREIIENEGIPVDERGFIDTSNDKRFPHHKNMPLLTYACMSPNLLPPEIRRVMDYIRKGRNMAAHIPAMTREQAEQFMQAFNAFSSWYYFHSGAYKSDQSKRLLAYMRLLMDAKGEVLLTILSSLAQDESRSISENSAWGIRRRFEQGTYKISTKRFLGYDYDKDDKLVVNKAQAKIVKRIYQEYLTGKTPDRIARLFKSEKIKNWDRGRMVWHYLCLYYA